MKSKMYSKTITAAFLLLSFCWNLNTALAQELPVNMAPSIAKPAGKPAPREPVCELGKDAVTLSNATLRCMFSTANKRLTLHSLYNEFTTCEMLLQPGLSAIFVVEANGKRLLGSRDFDLNSISHGDNGFEAILGNPEFGIQVILRASIDTEGLRLSSKFENSGAKALDFKVAFPCIGGLKLSDKIDDDYYYFPWGGGVFSSRPTNMRLCYGDNQALWQVMDVFSPAKGGGVYLRGDDDKGFHKTMSLRKFMPGQPEQVADQYMRNTTKAEYLWKTSALDQLEGTSLAIEYFRRTRQPGQSYQPPPAVLAAHAGNWKAAMTAYSNWAHKVWTWRPYPSKLKNVWNIGITGWPNAPLFVSGKYRDDFLSPPMDAAELFGWWEWNTVGPGGRPLDKLPPVKLNAYGPYIINDPVSGEKRFLGSTTDYVHYNDRFGGLDTFRAAVASNKRPGKLLTLYTDPFRLDEFNNETGRKFGRKWDFVDHTGKSVIDGDAVKPCFYLPEVQDWLVATVQRVLRETDADGIRLDEVGYASGACFAPGHQHVAFEEPGLSEWNKAMADCVRRVRAAMNDVKPTAVLMSEFPGYDCLFASLDGCLSYDLSMMDTGGGAESVRVLEVNLQRFYFPECKVFEINHQGCDSEHKKKFWNGVASFAFFLPTPFYNIYKDNEDVYASRDCEPLVPTLAPRVYANRFSAGDKTLFHLFNASGRDYTGPVLEIAKPTGRHAFDLLNSRELAISEDAPRVNLSVKNNGVACIAILPSLLKATRTGDLVRVSVRDAPNARKLSICGADGGCLMLDDIKTGENQFDLSVLRKPNTPEPVAVKLLDVHGLLLDIVAI